MTISILIVDDDPVQRRRLTGTVERFGYRATAVTDGKEALDRLAGPEGDAFSLVILDLVTPDQNGMAVLTRLKELDRPIPVIVQTAHGASRRWSAPCAPARSTSS